MWVIAAFRLHSHVRQGSAPTHEPACGTRAYTFPSFADYAKALGQAVPAVNVAALIGHSALRLAVMKDITRKANRMESLACKALPMRPWQTVRQAFRRASSIRPMAQRMRRKSLPFARRFAEQAESYATHMRDEFDHVLDSIDVSVRTARCGTDAARHFASQMRGPANWAGPRDLATA